MELNDFYKDLYDEAMASLQKDLLFKSRVHGQGHIERVLDLGAHIAQNESLDTLETKMLLLCCSYHDIGRHSDWYDPVHGSASAKKIKEGFIKDQFDNFNDDDMAIMLAAISAHSDHDSKIGEYETSYNISNHDRFMRIVTCLKDADNLDRVRINKLDPSYLRHEKSREMVPYAWELYRNYGQSL